MEDWLSSTAQALILFGGVRLQAPTINPEVQYIVYQSLSEERHIQIAYLARKGEK